MHPVLNSCVAKLGMVLPKLETHGANDARHPFLAPPKQNVDSQFLDA